MRKIAILPVLFLLSPGSLLGLDEKPAHVVFTYMDDPSTTLTVNWQTRGPNPSPSSVSYDTEPRNGAPEKYRHRIDADVSAFKGLAHRWIYRATLRNLLPGTVYHLVVGSEESGFSPEISVRTIPDDDATIRLVTGGDMGPSSETRHLLKQAAQMSPAFAVVGGDIAYANGNLEKASLWDEWLQIYTEEMRTPGGLSIPLVLAIGNHEVDGGFGKSREEAPFYFQLFGQEAEKSYFSRKFGQNLALIVLDSGHVASHESQVPWLNDTLQEFEDLPHKVAVYHVPLYPSHRSYYGHYSKLGRKYWLPVFDRYALTVGFENHDHTFKRSHLLKNNKIAGDGHGTLFLGDGCWGRSPRQIRFFQPWYLARSASERHFWVADFGPKTAVYRAVDMQGRVFDIYPESTPEAAETKKAMTQIEKIYFVPDEAVVTSGLVVAGDTWSGGETTIKFSNPFDRPAEMQVKLADPKGAIEALDWGPESFRLAPGETKTQKIRFAPTAKAPLSIKDHTLMLDVRMKLPPPSEGVPPEIFHSPILVPFHH